MNFQKLKQSVVFALILPGSIFAYIDEQKMKEEIAGELPESVLGLVDYLKDSQSYERVGAPMPRGILMYGPPGCGKTTIARAMAKAAGCVFISAVASEFDGILVGQGAEKIKEFFNDARQKARYSKVMIFIDEIDALAGKRLGGERNMDRQTLCELLAQLDGFDKDANKNIVVFAATNRKDFLDEAVLRRFDEHVYIGLPNEQSRKSVLLFHAKKVVLDASVDFALLAKKTEGWNCSELRDLVVKAARIAAFSKAKAVSAKHFECAFHFIMVTRKGGIRKPGVCELLWLKAKGVCAGMYDATADACLAVKKRVAGFCCSK